MNKLEIEMERRRVLHNKENTEKTIQILESIEFNKKCMELYKNSDFDKIKRLLIENIHLYYRHAAEVKIRYTCIL